MKSPAAITLSKDLRLNKAFKLTQNLQVEVMTLRRIIVGRLTQINRIDIVEQVSEIAQLKVTAVSGFTEQMIKEIKNTNIINYNPSS